MGGILPVNGITTRGKYINLPQSKAGGDTFLTFRSQSLELNSDTPVLKTGMPAPELITPARQSTMPAQELPMLTPEKKTSLPAQESAIPLQESGMPAQKLSMPAPELKKAASSPGSSVPNNSIKKEGENATSSKKEDSEEKKKYHIPWKKIGIGVLLATAFIEFNLRRDPRRKRQIEDYAKIFSNTTGTEIRNFSMIPYREEVIITQAANGSKKANEMFPLLHCDAKGIKKYIQINRRIENARKLYIEGRFEEYSTDTCSNRQIQKEFFKGLKKLKKQSDALYKKCIEPLLD